MPIFKVIDRKNNRTIFIQSKRSLFLGQTVLYIVNLYFDLLLFTLLLRFLKSPAFRGA